MRTLSHGEEPAPTIPDYELLRRIGQGSYGDVWLARGVTGLYRAIKVVWRARFADAAPFEREFKGLKEFAAISLGESIQLALLHIGRNDEAGFFYYVMELADDAERGRDIDPARYVPLTLTEVRRRRGRVPAADCVNYGVELARVLAGLHQRGLVHRDIKPSNVILVSGVAKVADIGLVTTATEARTYIGTEGFVPPEGPGTPAGDVFALGKLLYELSTGLDRQEFPRLPPDLDRMPDRRGFLALNEVVLRACEPAPEKRHRDASALLADLLPLQAGPAERRRGWLMAAAVAALVVVAAVWVMFHGKDSAVPVAMTVPAMGLKSIAVLPFTNLSEEKDGAFFSDGVHEDVLTGLGLIRDLRVVSRTSVMPYRNTTKSAGQIGRELGVAYLLEGTVRRMGNRVRVTSQLIDARSDRQAWAQTYDRDLTDIFAIQSDIAGAIATALQTALTSGEQDLLARRPTRNPTAYDLYLRARAIKNSGMGGLAGAAPLLESAVQVDPGFAEAWAELAYVYVLNYYWDRSADRLEAAKAAIDTAVRLAPDDPVVVQCLGDYYYYGHHDYIRATEQYLRLLQLRPNDGEMHHALGLIHRRQGRWVEALAELQKAWQIEPKNRRYAAILIGTHVFMRHFAEAERLARQVVQENPRIAEPAQQLALVTFLARGSARETEALGRGSFAPGQAEDLAEARWRFAAAFGNWAEFLRLDRERRAGPEPMGWDENELAALVLLDSGDRAAAVTRADAALALLVVSLENAPADPFLLAHRGILRAVKGDRKEALDDVDKAIALCTEPRDAITYPNVALARASVLARLGDTDRALDGLAELFHTPAGAFVHSVRLGISRGISFVPLRGNPRFEAMLNDPRNNAPLF